MYRLHDKSRGSRSRWIGYRVPFALGVATLVGAAAVILSSAEPNKTPGLTASATGQNKSQANLAPIPTQVQEAVTVGTCTKTSVPFKTVYNDSDQMYVGESKEVGGTDGSIQTCKPDSSGNKPADVNVAPVDKVVTLGTLPRPAAATPQPAVPDKKNSANDNKQSAKKTCKQSFMDKLFRKNCRD